MILKKRGQITIFIILGMVILVVFGFLLRVSSEVQRLKLEGEAERIITEVEHSQAIKHYVYLCQKQSAEEALLMLGSQGGRVYDYQNGSSGISDTAYLGADFNGTPVNISFGFTSPKLKPPYNDSPYLNAPWYPEYREDYSFVNLSRKYYLGDGLMPFLCDENGPNKYNSSRNFTGASCKIRNAWYWGTSPDTFQIQLANYTSYLTKECIDVDYFKSFTGYNLKLGDPSTIVIFGENDVSFRTYFPIDIIFNTKGSFIERQVGVTKGLDFSVTLPVRIKRIYDFFLNVVDEERKNLGFEFNKDYPKTASFKVLNSTNDLVQVEKTRISTDTYEEIIRLTDYYSIIRGIPYTFQILTQNRIPVLDWIHTTPQSSDYDISVLEETIIRIIPIGYDPDEDYYDYESPHCKDKNNYTCMDRNYTYYGWRETEDYYFNFTCCMDLPESSLCLEECVTITQSEPKNWTNSPPYLGNFREAEYKTSKKDIGYHNVTVMVCDEEGLCDWQIVKIVVYDQIRAEANTSNNFEDIDNEYASVEDPYTLSATGSSIVFPDSGLDFEWCDDREFSPPFCKITQDSDYILPDIPFDIENITNSLPIMHFSKEGLHELNVTVKGERSYGSAEFNVTVFECLPTRASGAVPFPFNDFEGDDSFTDYDDNPDPFQTNHICCEGNPKGDREDWRRAGSSKICYNFTSYGGFWSFDDELFEELETRQTPFDDYDVEWGYYYDSLNLITRTIEISNSPTYASLFPPLQPGPDYDYSIAKFYGNNDIYKRYFTTKCRGNRGNICDNNPKEVREVVKSCGDSLAVGQEEKCSGPPTTYFTSEQKDKYQCIDYSPGDSFEKNLRENILPSMDMDKSDGQCNEEPKCSSGTGVGAYDTFGDYLCRGQCDGFGNCNYASKSDSENCVDCRCEGGSGNEASIESFTEIEIGSCITGEIWGCGGVSCTIVSGRTTKKNVFKDCERWEGSGTLDPQGVSCRLRQYLINDEDGVCGTEESCNFYDDINPDENQTVCKLLDDELAGPITFYNELSQQEDRKCCGDDRDEQYDTTQCSGSVLCSDTTGCRKKTECVYNNTAYMRWQGIENYVDIDGDNDTDYCYRSGGNAKWYDCNSNSYCGSEQFCCNDWYCNWIFSSPQKSCLDLGSIWQDCWEDYNCQAPLQCKFNFIPFGLFCLP